MCELNVLHLALSRQVTQDFRRQVSFSVGYRRTAPSGLPFHPAGVDVVISTSVLAGKVESPAAPRVAYTCGAILSLPF